MGKKSAKKVKQSALPIFTSIEYIEKPDHILICLNRAEKHNAFSPEMIDELQKAFQLASKSKEARAVVLTGAGPSFCAGADLDWMKNSAKHSLKVNLASADKMFQMFQTAWECPVPVIGRIHGNVMGGGLGLTSICDIVAADSRTVFCFSEVKIGLVPAVISSFAAHKINKGKLSEWMLTGVRFGAVEAEQAGLVQFVGSSEGIDAFVQTTLNNISAAGPEAVRETKKLIRYLPNHTAKENRKESVRVIAKQRVGKEAQERMAAWFKRS